VNSQFIPWTTIIGVPFSASSPLLFVSAPIRVNLWQLLLTSIHLAAFRTIKEDPDRKVLTEIFKAMFDAGRGDRTSWRLKAGVARRRQIRAAAGHDVDFVSRVGSLRVVAVRRVQLHTSEPWFEHAYRQSPSDRADAPTLRHGDPFARVVSYHVTGYNTLQCPSPMTSFCSCRLRFDLP